VLEQTADGQPAVRAARPGELGGALSGRDIEAVSKTVSGLIKLLYPDAAMKIPDEDLEMIVARLALEARRRVKEQQKARAADGVSEHAFQLSPWRRGRGAIRFHARIAQR